MSEIEFTRNYRDMCVARGVDAGFQFEFYCERCQETWRSHFVPYVSGQASGWVEKAGRFFGGVASGIGSAVDGLAQAGFGVARDGEFAKAIEESKQHFRRCAKCHSANCPKCWNEASGLCYNCAPDVHVEIEAARTHGEIAAASEAAVDAGKARAAHDDVKTDQQLVCPQCKAETHGAKFCPECGHRLAAAEACPQCKATLPPGAKFCPECGHHAAA